MLVTTTVFSLIRLLVRIVVVMKLMMKSNRLVVFIQP